MDENKCSNGTTWYVLRHNTDLLICILAIHNAAILAFGNTTKNSLNIRKRRSHLICVSIPSTKVKYNSKICDNPSPGTDVIISLLIPLGPVHFWTPRRTPRWRERSLCRRFADRLCILKKNIARALQIITIYGHGLSTDFGNIVTLNCSWVYRGSSHNWRYSQCRSNDQREYFDISSSPLYHNGSLTGNLELQDVKFILRIFKAFSIPSSLDLHQQ
ncbi:hypothetical protein LENED_009449 [Lentinula edodes]|uniref:Uncharacterized protein n=1 Tax=Lentinula edodes TaxID=5353 RepID=A0A1Q3EJW6_LENED|nr:hypothetical protein LENED_009449 [Lentinula edodes]